MPNDPESKRREDLRLPCSSHHVAEQQKGEWVPQGLSSLRQIQTFLYSDGGSQGHFSGWQGHLQHPSGLLQPLMASGPPVPSSRLGTCLSPTLAPRFSWGNPGGLPIALGGIPSFLALNCRPLQPHLFLFLWGSHTSAHTHAFHPQQLTLTIHTCIHSQYMHIYSHTLLHTHTHICLHSHTCAHPFTHTHSYRCTHIHSFLPYHWGTLTHKHTCALTYMTFMCALT